MSAPQLVCTLEGSGALIWQTNSFDHVMREGDFFDRTVGGVTLHYKVESSVIDVESYVGDPHVAHQWTIVTQRIVVSVVP